MANNVQRRLREKNEMRLKILDAARDLFTTGGEEAVTLRKVAEKIEYSATTIYLHFADKEALLRELCTADFLVFSRTLKQAERIGDPVERLRQMASAYVDFGLQYPGYYRLMYSAFRHEPAVAAPRGNAPFSAGSHPENTSDQRRFSRRRRSGLPVPGGLQSHGGGLLQAGTAGCRGAHADVLERIARRGLAAPCPRQVSCRCLASDQHGKRTDDRLPDQWVNHSARIVGSGEAAAPPLTVD